MGNLRDEDKLRNMQPTDVVLGADEDGCLVNFPPDNFSGSIPISIDTETGEGEELFTEPEVNSFLFKKIKSEDDSIEFTTDTDGNIDASVNFPTIPTVDYPVIESEDVGEGVSLRRNLVSKKIGIRTLKSDNFVITEEIDGSVKINTAGGGSVSNDWYLDANFTRPLNWVADETISGTPIPKGNLNDPFKTYEEYLLKRIYGVGGSGTGTPSKFNPKYPQKTLQILSDINTSSDIEVINTNLYLRNSITLTYTGTRDYAIDYSTIFNSLTGGGNLPLTINNTISGEGSITSLNKFGLIYHKSDATKTSNGNSCLLNINPEGKGLFFVEGNNSLSYTNLTNQSGNPLKYGDVIVQGVNQSPTIPLISIEGNNNGSWSAIVTGTKMFIRTNTQIGIRCFNSGRITSSVERFAYQVGNKKIGYQTRLDNTSTGTNLQIVNFFEDVDNGNGKVYYKPYDTYVMFKGEDDSYIRIENLVTEPNGFANAGANSIVSISGTATFNNVSTMNDVGGAPALNFIKISGSTTTQSFNNSNIGSRYFNFIEGDTSNTATVSFKNSQIEPRNIQTDVLVLNIDTAGTYSAIKKIPINTGLVSIADNATAIAPPYNYIAGMEYFNTTENAISRVS